MSILNNMTNLKNKTIQSTILILIICLIAGYIYYDFQRSQKIEKEMADLKMEMVASRNQTAGLGESPLEKELATETEFIRVGGMVKSVEDGIIVLEGKAFSLEEKMRIEPGDPDNKEYRISIDSKTKIDKAGIDKEEQEIKLENLEEGNIISVMGKSNSFNKQEVMADSIFVLR